MAAPGCEQRTVAVLGVLPEVAEPPLLLSVSVGFRALYLLGGDERLASFAVQVGSGGAALRGIAELLRRHLPTHSTSSKRGALAWALIESPDALTSGHGRWGGGARSQKRLGGASLPASLPPGASAKGSAAKVPLLLSLREMSRG